jgi:hypothetical protein
VEKTTPQTKEQEDVSVRGAVRDVVALRTLTKCVNMRTTHSQTAILKTLSPGALARVAVVLAEMDWGVQ